MYNPFKPHLVRLYNGNYAIRKRELFLWTYLDREETFWWFRREAVIKYTSFPNLTQAMNRLRKHDQLMQDQKHFARRVK